MIYLLKLRLHLSPKCTTQMFIIQVLKTHTPISHKMVTFYDPSASPLFTHHLKIEQICLVTVRIKTFKSFLISVTRKKSPIVHKSLPKMISLEIF